LQSKVWPVVMLLGALIAGGFGTFAATHGMSTDGAVRANGGWDPTTILNGLLSASGVGVMIWGWMKSKWPKAAPVIDAVEQLLQKYLPQNVQPTIKPEDAVRPAPAPAIDLPQLFNSLLQFVTSHGVEGELKFRLGGQVVTWKIEPGEDPAAPLQLVPPAMQVK